MVQASNQPRQVIIFLCALFSFGLLSGISYTVFNKTNDTQVLGTQIEGTTTTWQTTVSTFAPVVMEQELSKPKSTTTTKPITTTTQKKVAPSVTGVARRTTTTLKKKTFLEIAQGEVGKRGSYADGGFWCDEFIVWVSNQAGLTLNSDGSPRTLERMAQEEGRYSDTPFPVAVPQMVFVDLDGPGGSAHGVTHAAIVENINGNEIQSIDGNVDNEKDSVQRRTRILGDGFIIGFAKIQ